MSVPTYSLALDLNGDGDWGDAGEDVSDRTFPGGVAWERGRDRASSIAGPLTGSLRAELDNTSGDYSPENTGSPIYPNFDAGVVARLQATLSAVTYDLFRGPLEEPSVDSEGRRVSLRALGTLSRLARTIISTPLFQNYRTDQCMEQVIGYAGLNVGTYSQLDQGRTTLPYWWASETDALTALVQLLYAEGPGAALYEGGDGQIIFHNRDRRRVNSLSTTAQATFSDTGAGALHVSPYRYVRGGENVVNNVELVVKSLTPATVDTTLWTWAGGEVTLLPGETWAFRVVLDDPTTEATLNFSGDYPSGGFPTFSTTLSSPFTGTHLSVEVENTDTVPLAFTGVTLVGKTTTTSEIRVRNRVQPSAASTTKYGIRTLEGGFQPWPYLALGQAQDLADAIVAIYQLPRSQVELTIENATAAEAGHILAREVGDRITVVDTGSAVNGDYWIEKLAHRVEEDGQWHRLALSCERCDETPWLIWDAGDWDDTVWSY